ncbi:hypothetical protein PR048_027887 [Dryococelus australis]|uniref:Uncharacterized protein n=1 Tax=Dryococelus australis TaxID=614101 RepID=A0ABQ9GHR2_9NEOP|nr:hypothetical protein PR048_027887 [Dryococelus australis]
MDVKKLIITNNCWKRTVLSGAVAAIVAKETPRRKNGLYRNYVAENLIKIAGKVIFLQPCLKRLRMSKCYGKLRTIQLNITSASTHSVDYYVVTQGNERSEGKKKSRHYHRIVKYMEEKWDVGSCHGGVYTRRLAYANLVPDCFPPAAEAIQSAGLPPGYQALIGERYSCILLASYAILLAGKLALAVCCTLLLSTLPPLERSSAADATGRVSWVPCCSLASVRNAFISPRLHGGYWLLLRAPRMYSTEQAPANLATPHHTPLLLPNSKQRFVALFRPLPWWFRGHTTRILPRRTGFDSRRVRSRTLVRGNCAVRCRWSTSFLGDFPFPVCIQALLHTHLTSLSSTLKTSIFRAAEISPLFHFMIEVSMKQCRNDKAGETGIPEKIRRPAASSRTISTCENPGVTRPGIEPGSPWLDASRLTAQPPWAPKTKRKLQKIYSYRFSINFIFNTSECFKARSELSAIASTTSAVKQYPSQQSIQKTQQSTRQPQSSEEAPGGGGEGRDARGQSRGLRTLLLSKAISQVTPFVTWCADVWRLRTDVPAATKRPSSRAAARNRWEPHQGLPIGGFREKETPVERRFTRLRQFRVNWPYVRRKKKKKISLEKEALRAPYKDNTLSRRYGESLFSHSLSFRPSPPRPTRGEAFPRSPKTYTRLSKEKEKNLGEKTPARPLEFENMHRKPAVRGVNSDFPPTALSEKHDCLSDLNAFWTMLQMSQEWSRGGMETDEETGKSRENPHTAPLAAFCLLNALFGALTPWDTTKMHIAFKITLLPMTYAARNSKHNSTCCVLCIVHSRKLFPASACKYFAGLTEWHVPCNVGNDVGQQRRIKSPTRVRRGEYGVAPECRVGGEAGDPPEDMPASGIVRHDFHMRMSGGCPAGNRARFALAGGGWSCHYTTAPPPHPSNLILDVVYLDEHHVSVVRDDRLMSGLISAYGRPPSLDVFVVQCLDDKDLVHRVSSCNIRPRFVPIPPDMLAPAVGLANPCCSSLRCPVWFGSSRKAIVSSPEASRPTDVVAGPPYPAELLAKKKNQFQCCDTKGGYYGVGMHTLLNVLIMLQTGSESELTSKLTPCTLYRGEVRADLAGQASTSATEQIEMSPVPG